MTVEQSPEISIIPIQTEMASNKYPKNNLIKIILLVILGLIMVTAIGIAGYVYLITKLSNAALGKSCLKDSDCVLTTQKKECCANPQAVNQKELTNNKQIIEYPFLLEMMLPRYPWCSLVKCKEYNISNPKAVCQSNKCIIISAKYISPTPTPDQTQSWETHTDLSLNYSFQYPPTSCELQRGLGDTTFAICYFPKGSDGGSKHNNGYVISLGFISKTQLSLMGVTYCDADFNDASRCELFKIGEVTASIDWGMGNDANANARISHPNGGAVTFALQPVTAESKEILKQILSTFKFSDKKETKFTCPQNGWVDCMPIMDEAKKLACSGEAETWYKANCPNFQGFAQ